MQAGWVVVLFLSGSGMLAWWVFPQWRPRVAAGWRRLHGVWLCGGAAMLLLPAAIVWWAASDAGRRLEGYTDAGSPVDERVALLLRGEQLVPPQPLPPEVFATAEIELLRPMTVSADRRWEHMDAAFVQLLLQVFQRMRDAHGYDMVLLEGYRSPERQNLLARKGAHVTMARAWQSYHQWGVAADCAFLRDGKVVISERDPWAMAGYRLFGEVAESLGLRWGGRWQMQDLGHVEWPRADIRAAMRAAHSL